MNDSERKGLRFYDAIKIKRLYCLEYLELAAGESESATTDDFTLLYCDFNLVTVKTPKREVRLKKSYCVFLAPGESYAVATDGAKVFAATFSADEQLTSVPCDVAIRADGLTKAIVSELISAARTIYSDAAIGRKISADGFFSRAAVTPSDDVPSATLQSVRSGMELLVIHCVKPVYKSFKSNVESELYTSESEKLTDKIKGYLAANLDRIVSLDELSAALFFSKSYLKAAFKKQTGKTIAHAHTEMKIAKAKTMLSAGTSVKKIADKLGFSSQNHFSTTFGKYVGMTPTEYRMSLHVGSAPGE